MKVKAVPSQEKMNICSESVKGYQEELIAPLRKTVYADQGITHELHKLYNEPDTMKVGRLRWLGHHFRMLELKPCGMLTLHKPEGTRRVGRPDVRWLESLEEDMKAMGARNWRRKPRDRDQWTEIVKEANVHDGV
jgi:hypothetical protein